MKRTLLPGKALRGGPIDHGFEHYFGIPASLDIPPYYFILGDRPVARPTNQIGASNSDGWTRIQGAFWRTGGLAPGYRHIDVTPRFTREAVRFIEQHHSRNKDNPFFLYLALPSPHTPWMPLDTFVGKSRASMYGDFTVQVDATVGQVLQVLDRFANCRGHVDHLHQ